VELLLHLQSLKDGRAGTPTTRDNDIGKRKEEQLLRSVQHFDIDFACGHYKRLHTTTNPTVHSAAEWMHFQGHWGRKGLTKPCRYQDHNSQIEEVECILHQFQ
jgi:hypothetical protein